MLGNKAALVERVSIYVVEGKDSLIVDPDVGANIKAKLSKLQPMGAAKSLNPNLLKVAQCPALDDPQRTENLASSYSLLSGDFFAHFASRSEDAVDDGEDGETVRPRSTDAISECVKDCQDDKLPTLTFRYFRGLDKGNCFFRDGHAQKVGLHTLPEDGSHCYIQC